MGIQVLVAELQELRRIGLRSIFMEDPRVSAVYDACSIQEIEICMQRYRFDLIVLNQYLIQDYAILGKNVLIMVEEFDLSLLKAAYNSGVRGYLSVNVSTDLLQTVLRLSKDTFLISPTIVPKIMTCLSYSSTPDTHGAASLTPREKEIVGLLQSGLDKGRIARELCIAETTLKTHIKNIAKKQYLKQENNRIKIEYTKV